MIRTNRARIVRKAGFPLGEFVRANREKSNLIGWRQSHSLFAYSREQIRQVENRLKKSRELPSQNMRCVSRTFAGAKSDGRNGTKLRSTCTTLDHMRCVSRTFAGAKTDRRK